jgi:hypothetical protein
MPIHSSPSQGNFSEIIETKQGKVTNVVPFVKHNGHFLAFILPNMVLLTSAS